MANDPEVEEFDRSQQKAIDDKEAAMRWEEQSTFWRVTLIISVVMITISGWIFKNATCFEDVVLTTKVDKPPLDGNFLNVFKLYGWIGLGFQLFSWVLYYAFTLHIKASVQVKSKVNQVEPFPIALPSANETANETTPHVVPIASGVDAESVQGQA